ncbi:MAG: Asp-tRNA(Asn)/Glu-tRNA(Gln) amidotransferase subunit GatC [Oscillochloridaceae bacterium umkhey_bin13]
MALTTAEVEHVARLARLQLNSDELEQMRGQLSDILAYIELLQEVDVAGVAATAQVTGLTTVLRPDEVKGALSREAVLANAPDQHEGMFRVKAVFEE